MENFQNCLNIAAGNEHVLLLAEKIDNKNDKLLDQSIDDTLIITEAANMGKVFYDLSISRIISIELNVF